MSVVRAIVLGATLAGSIACSNTDEGGMVGPATQVGTTIPMQGTVRKFAVDPAAHALYATDFLGLVWVIDTRTDKVIDKIEVGAGAQGLALDPDTRTLYTADYQAQTISIVNIDDKTLTATIPIGNRPDVLALDPVTNSLYVSHFGADYLSVIDQVTRTVTTAIPIGTYTDDMALDPAGNRLYLANFGTSRLTVIDTRTNTITRTIDCGGRPRGVAVAPATQRVYCANDDGSVTVLDTWTGRLLATIPVGGTPFRMSVDPAACALYLTKNDVRPKEAGGDGGPVVVIDTDTNAVTATLLVGDSPQAVAVDPSSHKVYVNVFLAGNVTVLKPGEAG
ncbi:YncE family protein [Nocardia sp. NPDC127526]|uniref:YncE family protein n=1 Tax=Nocardia sp. NPDC127526 TaxID=3345393 RepID=UPI003635FEB1